MKNKILRFTTVLCIFSLAIGLFLERKEIKYLTERNNSLRENFLKYIKEKENISSKMEPDTITFSDNDRVKVTRGIYQGLEGIVIGYTKFDNQARVKLKDPGTHWIDGECLKMIDKDETLH